LKREKEARENLVISSSLNYFFLSMPLKAEEENLVIQASILVAAVDGREQPWLVC
jgi:hypothetical protein